MSENQMSKRDIVAKEIEKGGATMESLCAAADCKYASIMSILSTLRLMGKCAVKDVPVKTKDGKEEMTYRFVTADEWDKMKAEQAANAKTRKTSAKTPEEQLAMAEKKVAQANTAAENAAARAEKNPKDPIVVLKAQITKLQKQLADLELKEVKANIQASKKTA